MMNIAARLFKFSSVMMLIISSAIFAQLPSFPGAMGFGATTPGGRGGQIIEVTNLNASGPGSFRNAVEASGPRIVVFRVGGTIVMNDKVTIEHPYLTIAGQTAPGDGILIRNTTVRIMTHDVIIRGLRIRTGDAPNGPAYEDRDCLEIGKEGITCYNIVVDHCSFSWGTDENVSTFTTTRDLTVQYSIISECLWDSGHPLGPHSMGFLIAQNSGENVSVHHNLFAHNNARNPKSGLNTTVEVINNVVYNYQTHGTYNDPSSKVNVIANHYIPGNNTNPPQKKGIELKGSGGGFELYVEDNIGPGRPTNNGDDWLAVLGSEQYRSTNYATTPSGIVADPVEDILDIVTANAGAITPSRDAVDVRIVNDVLNGTGSLIDTQSQVGGWPTLAGGTAPQDSDGDGMPDSWELTMGLNPNSAGDGNSDLDGDGYTNVEEYINGLIVMPGANSAPSVPSNLRVER